MPLTRALLIAGMPGAGKSVIRRAAEELGIPVFTMGDIVRREAEKRGLEPNDKNLGLIASELRQKYGKGVLAQLTVEAIKKEKHSIIVIDGVRSLDEVNVFKNNFNEVITIAVHASPKTRFERLRARGRNDDPRSPEELAERDLRELRYGLGNVIALADYMLVNENITLKEFLEEAKKLLKKLAKVGEEK